MRERAAMLGGSVVLDSAPGKGTHLTLLLPMAKMTAAPAREVEIPTSKPAIGSGD